MSDSNLKFRLADILGPNLTFWSRYLGTVAAVVGGVYPNGVIDDEKIRFFAHDEEQEGGGLGRIHLKVTIRENDPSTAAVMVHSSIKDLAKIGDRKKSRGIFRRTVILNLVKDLE